MNTAYDKACSKLNKIIANDYELSGLYCNGEKITADYIDNHGNTCYEIIARSNYEYDVEDLLYILEDEYETEMN